METLDLKDRQLSLFSDRLPYRPYCTDNLSTGLRVLPLQAALERRYIQYNPPAMIHWLAFDIDYEVTDQAWQALALPNIVICNPDNNKAHLLYGIASGVCKTSAGRYKPLRLLSAINEAYKHALGGDVGFAELVCKNPLHSHWRVEVHHDSLYSLHDLAAHVDLAASARRVKATPKREVTGLGRNCSLFDSLRTWSYKWIRDYRKHGAFERWHVAVLERAERLNTFAIPLPGSEVRATARSVSKWTWNHYSGHLSASALAADGMTPEVLLMVQSHLGKRGNEVRWGDSSEKRAHAVEMSSRGIKQVEIACWLGIDQATVSRWLRQKKRGV